MLAASTPEVLQEWKAKTPGTGAKGTENAYELNAIGLNFAADWINSTNELK